MPLKFTKHLVFLRWLLLFLLASFGVWFSFYTGAGPFILLGDKSFISLFVVLVGLVFFLVQGWYTFRVSRLLNISKELWENLEKGDQENFKRLMLNSNRVTNFLTMVLHKTIVTNGKFDAKLAVENFSEDCHERSEISYLVPHKLRDFGFLGTAIGFSVALFAFVGLDVASTGIMTGVLTQVSEGMSIALFTTITAIAFAIPLEFNAFLLERATNQVVSYVVKIINQYLLVGDYEKKF